MNTHALLIELATRLAASADRVGASDEDGAMAVSRAIDCIASEIRDLAYELADQSQQEAAQMAIHQKEVVVCDFCGKDQHAVAHMFAGPTTGAHTYAICSECIDLCAEIVAEQRAKAQQEAA